MCGLGEDGHTMSLFPGNPAVGVKDRLVVGVHDAPKPPPDRISFTLDLVHAARRTILLTAGASKAEALAAVLEGPDPHVPSSLLRFGRTFRIRAGRDLAQQFCQERVKIGNL